MKTLRPFLLAILLLGMAPLAVAAPAGPDFASEGSLWSDIVDQVVRAVEALLPDTGGTPNGLTAEGTEPPQEPTPESYPLAEPFG